MVSQPSPTTIVACSVVSLVFAAVTLVLRLVARVHFVKIFGAEDAFIALALVLSTCHVTGVIYQVRFGLGTHVEEHTSHDIELFLKALFLSIITYVTGHTLAKISILCLYIRAFGVTKMRKVYYGMLIAIGANGFWLIFSGIFSCVPVQGFWDTTVSATCLPRKPMWFSNAAINILSDFALFLSPMVVLRPMTLPRRHKIGLYFVFGLGLFVCVISIIRFYYLYYGAESVDVTWIIAGVSMWSAVELNVAIVCACLLVMKPLFLRLFPGLFIGSPISLEDGGSHIIPLTVPDTSSGTGTQRTL
ncbi:hypothetical protein QBC47DRAFT_371088 [Echria macrotheca]|uniref:Rhodopsin domain-containing protein n=1 Tax=Echria macrotheca TaxID=438768 RepID=A0AAJ0FET7_9PEZI|nr:hypothetical protein QBC47DRAFT_371088 [Echria macrotheca]